MSKWISVKDKLPKEGNEILIFNIIYYKPISIGYLKNNNFFDLIDSTMTPIKVTHWMPLPEPTE